MNRILELETALESLLLAYAKADERVSDSGIEWEDVDSAFELAYRAMPDTYERLVNQLELETEE